jgi:hypothetical protein
MPQPTSSEAADFRRRIMAAALSIAEDPEVKPRDRTAAMRIYQKFIRKRKRRRTEPKPNKARSITELVAR